MLSLVIPIYNEEKIIDELVKRTIKAIESFTGDYEVIFVDDGSSDNSSSLILKWRGNNKKIKLLSLSKNFGHQAAYTAGLENAKGDIIAMMDGDLQDPPELLPEMYRKITGEDFDIVSGKRTGRKGNKGRNLSALLFHFIFKNIGEIQNMENYGNYSMMKRIAVDALLSMKERVRYLPGLRTFIGFRQGYVEFVRDDRFQGKPKMTIRKLFILASRCYFFIFKVPDHVLSDSRNNRYPDLYGCRNLCGCCQSCGICCHRMVLNFIESSIFWDQFSWFSSGLLVNMFTEITRNLKIVRSIS